MGGRKDRRAGSGIAECWPSELQSSELWSVGGREGAADDVEWRAGDVGGGSAEGAAGNR